MARNTRPALAAYLSKHGISVDDFAAKVGAHRSQIYRCVRGERGPGLELACAIEKVTGGEVSRDRLAAEARARRAARRSVHYQGSR